MKNKKFLGMLLLFLFLLIAAACSNGEEGTESTESPEPAETPVSTEPKSEIEGGSGKLIIYTARDQSVVDQVVEMFNEKHPDVEVEVLTMGAQQILERVRGEKANPQADFWWGGTQSALMVAASEDLLE